MPTPSVCPSTINSPDNPQYSHIIPSDDYSICSGPPLPITIEIQPIPSPPAKDPTIEPSDETINKNYVEPLSICTINIFHNNTTNILPVPPSSTP